MEARLLQRKKNNRREWKFRVCRRFWDPRFCRKREKEGERERDTTDGWEEMKRECFCLVTGLIQIDLDGSDIFGWVK